MKLFKCTDGFNVEIDPMLYGISEFAELLESRKKNLDLLKKELHYIYFFADMSSDFQFNVDERLRHNDLIKYTNLPATWKKDKLIEDAIDAYKYLSTSISSELLQSVRISVDKIKKQLETIDINERDKMGKPIWNLKQFQEIANKLPETMASIDKAEKQYIKIQEENNVIRNNKTKNPYDGQDLSKI